LFSLCVQNKLFWAQQTLEGTSSTFTQRLRLFIHNNGDRSVCTNYRGFYLFILIGKVHDKCLKMRCLEIIETESKMDDTSAIFVPAVVPQTKFSLSSKFLGACERHVLSTSRKHVTRFLVKRCGECCGGTVLSWQPSIHCIPAQKYVSVSGKLNHNCSPWVLNSDKGVALLPLLFIVCMDWIDSHSRDNAGVIVVCWNINRFPVSDYLVLLTVSKQGLQHALDRFAAAWNRAGMKIGAKKWAAMSLKQPKAVYAASERQYTAEGGEVPGNSLPLYIGVRAGKFVGVRKICARISRKLPEKCSGKYLWKYFFPHRSWTGSFGMTSIKKHSCDSPHARHQFFKIKQRWAPFLPIFQEVHPNVHAFCEHFHRFSQIFTNFQGFRPDFRQIKPLGVALAHPAAPPPKPLPQHDIH